MGIMGKRMEKPCIGGRARTMAGAGPTGLLSAEDAALRGYKGEQFLGFSG